MVVVICQPPGDPASEKVLVGAPALLSVLAIAISLWTFFYNKRKDDRVRAQSIQDDFWLRKVVSPLSIEPFLKFTNAISADLPTVDASESIVKIYWATQVVKLGEFSVAFQALDLIDSALNAAVAAQLSAFEDALAEYCGHLINHLCTGGPKPEKATAVQGLLATTLAIFRLIQTHQIKVGTA